MKIKRILALVLALVLAAALCACGSEKTEAKKEESSGEAKTADCVVVACDDDSFTMGPWGQDNATRKWVEWQIYTHLTYRPFTGAMLNAGEMELVAAKEITKVDDLTYDVVIYDNIVDTKGNKITAEDVVFSYDSLAEFAYTDAINNYYASSKVLGDYELEITLKMPDEGAIEEVLTRCSIVSKAWYEGATEEEILNTPACTGAYAITDVQAAHSVVLEARDDYWKTDDLTTCELQNVKKIQLLCIAEADARAIALENDEVDMAEIDVVAVPTFEENSDKYVVTRYANAMNDCLLFNCNESSVCSDVNVRKAIAYSLDFSQVYILGFGNKEFEVHFDVCPDQTPDYQDEWNSEDYYARDLDKVKECLAEAGYGEGELHVRLIVRTQAPQGAYQVMQQQMNEAGIDCEIIPYDRAVFMSYEDDPTAWDILVTGTSVVDFTTTYWNQLFSEEAFGTERGTEGFAVDPKLQELLRAASADRSAENMKAFHDYYTYDQCYEIGMYNEGKVIVTKAGLTDVHITSGDPVLNAMTFTSDYTSVGLHG